MNKQETVYELVTDWMQVQKHKHDLAEDYVNEMLCKMTRDEFLFAISDAIEERLK